MSFNFHHFLPQLALLCSLLLKNILQCIQLFQENKNLTFVLIHKNSRIKYENLTGSVCLLICLRNTFTMHVEAGHYNNMPEDLAKDLRCPLCLYHTKRKSNMIDHIVLHRGTLPSKWNRPHSMFFCFFTSQLYRWVMLWETGFQCCGSGGRINLRVKGSVRVNIVFFFLALTI